MRQLRLMHLSDDGTSLLVETYDGIERFSLPVDPVLRSAVRSAQSSERPAAPPPSAAADTAHSPDSLGPREIQMRVRAGQSPEQVAKDAGMNLDSVLRFAGPVVDERGRIADEARRARARRTSNESQVVVFGEAVDERFEAHGIAAGTVEWDARRRDDGEWVVYASWHGGNDTYVAEWLFHRTSRTVTPADETAVDLLSDSPVRPIVAPPQDARHNLREAPPLVPGVVSFPPMPDAFTGPLPAVDDVFDQDAEPEGPRDIPPLHAVQSDAVQSDAVQSDAAPGDRDNDASFVPGFDEQPLPLVLTGELGEPVASGRAPLDTHASAHSDAERAARAKIPSWDDILLGVRRKTD